MLYLRHIPIEEHSDRSRSEQQTLRRVGSPSEYSWEEIWDVPNTQPNNLLEAMGLHPAKIPPEIAHNNISKYASLGVLETVTYSPWCFLQRLNINTSRSDISFAQYQLAVEGGQASLALTIKKNSHHESVNLFWDYRLRNNRWWLGRVLTGDESVFLERSMRLNLISRGNKADIRIGTHHYRLHETYEWPAIVQKGAPRSLHTKFGRTNFNVIADEDGFGNTIVLEDVSGKRSSQISISIPSIAIPDNLSNCGHLDQTNLRGLDLLGTTLMPVYIT